MDSYRTLAGEANAELVEKRSRFLGCLRPVGSATEALSFVEEIKKRHYDARHHVFAYRLRDGAERYSDDGEPQGTAGLPVLDVLQKQELYDVCAVVTRYFGGILLGGGGLVRAYSRTAALAVEAGQIVRIARQCMIELRFAYEWYGKVSYLIEQRGLSAKGEFGQEVTLSLTLPKEACDSLLAAMTELTGGRFSHRLIGERYAPLL